MHLVGFTCSRCGVTRLRNPTRRVKDLFQKNATLKSLETLRRINSRNGAGEQRRRYEQTRLLTTFLISVHQYIVDALFMVAERLF
jgi:hypothetical protein